MSKKNWDLIITAKNDWISFNLKEIFYYKDLIYLMVKRDFVVFYKQTILGPLWYILQPLVNTLIFTIIFGNIAKIPTDGLPPFLFYMSGNIIWMYFSTCLTLTSNTFLSNAQIFSKVYFPRLTIPISFIIITLVQLLIQFSIFILFLIYYSQHLEVFVFSFKLFYLPLIILLTAFLSIGFGILISALTTKYRDLSFVLSFGIQLWMFATPIVYPLSLVEGKYRYLFYFNPMTFIVESFREIFFGIGTINFVNFIICIIIAFVVFFIGLFMFNKIEKNFMDTI